MTDQIDRAPFYHDGMRELQDRFDGRRVADGLQKHRLHFEFWEQDRKLIEEARAKGYRFLRITTGAQNDAMRALANKFGAHLTFRYGESTGTIDVKEQPRLESARPAIVTPADAAQKRFQSQALELTQRLVAIRQLLSSAGSGRPLPLPILVVVLVCSSAIFTSFSLFVQPNPTVIVALVVSALTVAGAVFLIVELNTPFGGLLQSSSGPAHATLATFTR